MKVRFYLRYSQLYEEVVALSTAGCVVLGGCLSYTFSEICEAGLSRGLSLLDSIVVVYC